MTFEEWLEAYYSGTQIDDETIGMMRSAFEAGRCEAGTVGLRDKFAMAAIQGLCAGYRHQSKHWDICIASDAYKVADAMLGERKE